MPDTNAAPEAQAGEATQTPVPVEQEEEAGGQSAEGDTGDGSGDGDGEGKKSEPTAEQREIHGLKRRINRLTSDKASDRATHKAEIEQLRIKIAELQSKSAGDDDEQQPHLTQADVKRLATSEAARMREQEHLRELINSTYERGNKSWKNFQDMDAAVGDEIGGYVGSNGQLNPATVAILSADKPHAVIKYFSENLEMAADFARMSQARQIRKVAQIEMELGKPVVPKPSGAPKPVEPIRGSSATVVDESKLSDKEWAARRRAARLAK